MNIQKICKGLKYIVNSDYRWLHNAEKGKYDYLPDEDFLRRMYKVRTGKSLHLSNPESFNEKMQWLKLYYRIPESTLMVDKYEAKKIVSRKIGIEHIVPTLGVWNSVDEIDFDLLPSKFVIKCTHDSGGLVICRKKEDLDIELVKQRLTKSMSSNYYLHGREWPYKNVKPRIIAEEYLQDSSNRYLPVYKIFNFDGRPMLIQAIRNDKTKYETIDYYDTDWKLLRLKQNFPNSEMSIEKPSKLSEMLEYAEQLSKGFPFLRTDFYSVNGQIYFSEFTFYSDSGFSNFYPEEWDVKLGKLIDLSKYQQIGS